jgi:5-methylcytosine-specific restriction endonuclease McrA
MTDLTEPQSRPIVTRAEALAAGLKHFFTGVPCKFGHVDERLTSSKACMECTRVRMRLRPREKWLAAYQFNAERIRERERIRSRAKRLAKNPQGIADLNAGKQARVTAREKGLSRYSSGVLCKRGHVSERFVSNKQCVACMGIWRASNPAITRFHTAAWKERNTDKQRTISRTCTAKRRALRFNSEGSYSAEEITTLLKKQKHQCANPSCRASIRNGFHCDHIIPLSKGGTNSIGNIQLLCQPCNLKKGSKDPIVWAQLLGRLL